MRTDRLLLYLLLAGIVAGGLCGWLIGEAMSAWAWAGTLFLNALKMLIVLGAVGLPLEGIGFILTVDWFLDRFRTTVNVWGDAVGAAVMDRFLETEGKEEAG